MNKFNVGDKVKVLRQDGVIHTYFNSIDCVFEVVSVFNTREYNISDGHVYQTAHEDDLALYTTQESPQEYDEWGPWAEDFSAYCNCVGLVLVEYDEGGEYVRHKVKNPVPKEQIEVGKSYVSKNNPNYPWECIYIEGDMAWLKKDDGSAYVWTLEGESISLPEGYNIDFSQTPKDQVPF